MDDSTALSYWRWTPDLPDGTYDTPMFGELFPGRIVEIRLDQSHLVANDPAWSKATKKAYDTQPTIEEERAARRQPFREEA